MRKCLCLMSVVLCLTASAQYIQETMTLTNGWNAIYLESTPENPACSDFFDDMPVSKVMLYRGSAYAEAPWIDENGQDILQPPVFYNVWIRNREEFSTLTSLAGGRCYLVFATAPVASKAFLGVPASPYVYWHKVSDTADDLLNIAGVSCQTNASVAATAYFKGGPANCQKVYEIYGTNAANPSVRQLIGASPKLRNGRAYSLAADRDGAWSGAIAFDGGDRLQVMGGYGSLRVRNDGTSNTTFRMTMVKSAKTGETFPPLRRLLPRTDIDADDVYTNVAENVSWDVPMAPKDVYQLKAKVNPSDLSSNTTYAAVLEIEDLGESHMRVRVPVSVSNPKSPVPFPTGLWAGTIAFDKVSSITNPVPVSAAGIMALNVYMFVGADRTAKLLQRVAVGTDTNGEHVVYRDRADVPILETPQSVRRLFTGMMSVETPEVRQIDGSARFGEKGHMVFAWSVPERARDNPFRHAWHPDHDGLSADYTMELPTGDNFRNYANPVKPELWSIGNVLTFDFDKPLAQNASGTAEGAVTWVVSGLVSTNTIQCTGSYRIRRLIAVPEMKTYKEEE